MSDGTSSSPLGTTTREWMFLGLPTEIRDQIYSLLIIEPPRLLRRHRPSCSFSHVQPGWGYDFNENPAWLPLKRCDCAKRQNLGILLVNRCVQADAARAFWSLNVFSFNGTGQFVRDVGLNLRSEYRSFIRHVVIYDKRQDFRSKDEFAMVHRPNLDRIISSHVWEVIVSCDSLETLYIRPELMMW
ncbi:hypothetical protein MGN70_007480 [Eutypa lata]|nr:hypothetical protein MGN70_007480 [Eutypa lata]